MYNQKFTNNSRCKLGASLALAGLTLTFETGKGDLFSTLAAGEFQFITIDERDVGVEIVKMTARTVDSATIERAQEGTTALDFTISADVFGALTAVTIQEFNDSVIANIDNAFDPALLGADAVNVQSGRLNDGALASGIGSVSLGWSAKSSGTYSISIGISSLSSALESISTGRETISSGIGSIACGPYSAATVDYTISHGYTAKATAINAIAIGKQAESNALNSISLGGNVINRVADSHAISGLSLAKKDHTEITGDEIRQFSSQENYVFSKEINLPVAAVDDIFTLTIPSGSSFFATECGFVITNAISVTVQPEISFGITGDSVALLAQTLTTASVTKSRERYQTLLDSGGQTTLTASLKVSATAVTFRVRFYFKGLLIENES